MRLGLNPKDVWIADYHRKPTNLVTPTKPTGDQDSKTPISQNRHMTSCFGCRFARHFCKKKQLQEICHHKVTPQKKRLNISIEFSRNFRDTSCRTRLSSTRDNGLSSLPAAWRPNMNTLLQNSKSQHFFWSTFYCLLCVLSTVINWKIIN